jgi:hypothetical protein
MLPAGKVKVEETDGMMILLFTAEPQKSKEAVNKEKQAK